MSEKSNKIVQLQAKIPLKTGIPEPDPDTRLLGVGLLCVLTRRLTPSQANKTLKALMGAFEDWNELRVSQIQEFSGLIATRNQSLALEVARDTKTYLQEVFQQNHGFDLEFLRDDLVEAGKFLVQLEFLGASAAHFLLWFAVGGEIPATSGIVRVLDRLGLAKRTSSMRKAQATLGALIPEKHRRDFALRYGLVVENWCDAKKPSCWECVLVESCPHGLKVRRDWEAQQKRLEEQRKREQERRRKEEEKMHRKALAEAKKRSAHEAKRREKAERERKRVEAQRAKAEARKRAAQKKEAEKAARIAARKKAAAKKAAAKKKSAKKKSAKKATKRPATKKKAAKKKASKQPTTKKKVAKKAVKKKVAKKATKKKATKKTTKTTKRPAAKKRTKQTTKKAAKKTTKKKAKTKAKKKTRRR